MSHRDPLPLRACPPPLSTAGCPDASTRFLHARLPALLLMRRRGRSAAAAPLPHAPSWPSLPSLRARMQISKTSGSPVLEIGARYHRGVLTSMPLPTMVAAAVDELLDRAEWLAAGGSSTTRRLNHCCAPHCCREEHENTQHEEQDCGPWNRCCGMTKKDKKEPGLQMQV